MNRRTFLASLMAIPTGVALAVKAGADPYQCVITPNFKGTIISRSWDTHVDWLRSTGRITWYSPEYEEALDRICKKNGMCLEGFRK